MGIYLFMSREDTFPYGTTMSEIVEAFPTVSDQGQLGTCSSHALGKCVMDGFMRGIYVPGRSVDFNQDVVIQVLNNEHKDGVGKQLDHDFDGREYLLQDAGMKYWTIS